LSAVPAARSRRRCGGRHDKAADGGGDPPPEVIGTKDHALFLYKLLTPGFYGIDDLLLSRYLAKGPGDELDDAVVAWLEARIKDGPRRYRWGPGDYDPLGAMVVDYLPKWTVKYPRLRATERAFREALKRLPNKGFVRIDGATSAPARPVLLVPR